ncbi:MULTISPECIES: COQ9 family protein [Rhodophyticola]|jgi:ubiquinone biosynthesis protein COQ9|uniref:COQ9 family protein n=1 Tax=Rhodophyticola TaxID=2680018 RepID=UPI001B075F65|nr:COQ9 family protein [Roseicyclus sp.]MBO6625374.1 COQ9 family protein [Roseicyclus sp.]MBO6922553.1 COQ9 family protein [Roseicyclus sp.]
MTDPSNRLIDAALDHVPFDGWSEVTFKAAMQDTEIDEATARALFPRGPVDLALAFHRRGDEALRELLRTTDLSEMRIRERITFAVRKRLELIEDHKEAVRRGSTLFALPPYAADGARAVWETCDAIWDGLGDPSDDINWYTKRGTLSGVYSATVLYWLGDQSEGHAATWAFLDRRIENVMQFEKLKKQVNDNKLLKPFLAGPNWLLSQVKAPAKMPRVDLPGSWTGRGRTDT